MHLYLKRFWLLAFTPFFLIADPIEVSLKNPIFSNGTLKTSEGGVLEGPGIRLQAQSIEYTNKGDLSKVLAEGDLMVEFQDRLFVGDRFEYNFATKTGTLWKGRTSDGLWFIGGEKIEFEARGNFVVYQAFLTACDSTEPLWEINAKSLELFQGSLLKASNVSFNCSDVPLFWVPSFKSDLKSFYDSPVRYQVVWDRGIGPRISFRYRVFSWKELSLFLRFDYRITEGPGGALESEYLSKEGRTRLSTRSYGAYSKLVYDEQGLKRYRLQGLLSHISEDQKTSVDLTYDKFRDLKMISDFPSSDFVISTDAQTKLLIEHKEEVTFASLLVEPRLNPFESLNQKLPLAQAGIRTFALGSSGILSDNAVSVGYLDYVYATDLLSTYPTLHEVNSGRFETRNRIYRPFSKGPFEFTPTLGFIGIFYTDSPLEHTSSQAAFSYGGTFQSTFYRHYSLYKHIFRPYLNYQGLTHPKANLDEHYTFSLNDGLYQINSLKMGIYNALFLKSLFASSFALDLYTYAFFNDKTFDKTLPKGYLSLSWKQPSYLIDSQNCWNFEENILDFANLRTEVTVNAFIAFSFELRHRSRYDWRKSDHTSFLLDMARSIPDLENSGVSDRRNTFLTKMHFKLSPKWTCQIASHYGWGRVTQPSYNSFKVDLMTLLASHWQCKLSYLHTTNDDRVSVRMQITK